MSSFRLLHSLRTSPNSSVSIYLMPPQARLDEFWLVKLAKSPRSINATLAPLDEREAADTAPLIPLPMIKVSKTMAGSLDRFVFRRLTGVYSVGRRTALKFGSDYTARSLKSYGIVVFVAKISAK